MNQSIIPPCVLPPISSLKMHKLSRFESRTASLYAAIAPFQCMSDLTQVLVAERVQFGHMQLRTMGADCKCSASRDCFVRHRDRKTIGGVTSIWCVENHPADASTASIIFLWVHWFTDAGICGQTGLRVVRAEKQSLVTPLIPIGEISLAGITLAPALSNHPAAGDDDDGEADAAPLHPCIPARRCCVLEIGRLMLNDEED